MSYLTSKAMQTTAIGTVANSLPENKVILITLLNSSRYIPYTDLRKKIVTAYSLLKKCARGVCPGFLRIQP